MVETFLGKQFHNRLVNDRRVLEEEAREETLAFFDVKNLLTRTCVRVYSNSRKCRLGTVRGDLSGK